MKIDPLAALPPSRPSSCSSRDLAQYRNPSTGLLSLCIVQPHGLVTGDRSTFLQYSPASRAIPTLSLEIEVPSFITVQPHRLVIAVFPRRPRDSALIRPPNLLTSVVAQHRAGSVTPSNRQLARIPSTFTVSVRARTRRKGRIQIPHPDAAPTTDQNRRGGCTRP